tara:strand:- start:10 stop:864 length:855 start_codon:yes stop_codon:yes gene_type:complete
MSKNEYQKMVVKDYSVTGENFEIIYDDNLEMWKTEPAPSEENLGRYYESENYISHTDSKKSLIDKIYQWVRIYMLQKKLKLVQKYQTSGSILDIGAGTGDFLKTALSSGWNVNGVEPNPQARKIAGRKGINLDDQLFSVASKKFDVITMWHVLEHVLDLKKHIEWLKNHLREEGTLFVAVPNYKSYDSQKYKHFWAAYDVPRHLHHFSQHSIKKLFAHQNLEVVDIQPMIFDAYYVSLLSEKYKKSKFPFFKAIISGTVSNLKATQTSEYSSLIYIIKHKKNSF